MSSRHSSFHACVVPALIHSCAGLVNTTGRDIELTCRLNLDSRELHLKYLLRVLVPHRETDGRGSRDGPPRFMFHPIPEAFGRLGWRADGVAERHRTERRTHKRKQPRRRREKQGGRHEPLYWSRSLQPEAGTRMGIHPTSDQVHVLSPYGQPTQIDMYGEITTLSSFRFHHFGDCMPNHRPRPLNLLPRESQSEAHLQSRLELPSNLLRRHMDPPRHALQSSHHYPVRQCLLPR